MRLLVNFLMIIAVVQFRCHGFRAERYFTGIPAQLRSGLVLGIGGSLWVLQSRIHELFISRYFGQENYAVYSAGCTLTSDYNIFYLGDGLDGGRVIAWNGLWMTWDQYYASSGQDTHSQYADPMFANAAA